VTLWKHVLSVSTQRFSNDGEMRARSRRLVIGRPRARARAVTVVSAEHLRRSLPLVVVGHQTVSADTARALARLAEHAFKHHLGPFTSAGDPRRCPACLPLQPPSPQNTVNPDIDIDIDIDIEQRSTTATMFRDFSFDPVSPPSFSAYEADRAAMNVSPTSQPETRQHYFTRPPTPPCTIGDLASKLNQQSLRIDTSVQDCCSGPPTPISDDERAKPLHAPRPTYSRVSASLLRMQRQSSSRMQCSPSHVRDIARLVQMIEVEEQCTIADVTSRSSSTSTTTTTSSSSSTSTCDEGVDMEYDAPREGVEALISMPQYRADSIRDSCVRVPRPVRMRRRTTHRVEKRSAS
jgi:hypothetical protein